MGTGSKQQYQVAVEIARGSLGVLGVGHGGNRVVLLRRLEKQPPWDDALLDGVAESASIAHGIHHPSLLAVLETSRSADALVVATEYVEGVPLSVLMQRSREQRRRPSTRVGMRIAEELARAVQAASRALAERGTPRVLGGLSPECVIVSSGDDALIADLGMVSLERVPDDPRLVAYRAPELVANQPAGEQAAVYSLGILLWELISGREAFEQSAPKATAAGVVARALKGAVPPLDRVARDVPPLLVEVVRQSIGSDPEARFPSVQAFADALAAISKGRRHGELVRAMNELASDKIEEQRRALVRSSIAPSSSRATIHALETIPPPAAPGKPRRRIGLAAFEKASAVPETAPAPPGRTEPKPEQPESVEVVVPPPAPLPDVRPPQPTMPMPLVTKATPQALAFDPDDLAPPRPRRWGLVLFLLLLMGGAAAVGAVFVKRELDAPPPAALPPPVPLPESGAAPASPESGDAALPPAAKAPRAGPQGFAPKATPDAPAASASASAGPAPPESAAPPASAEPPPAPNGEQELPDNPYQTPPPPSAGSNYGF